MKKYPFWLKGTVTLFGLILLYLVLWYGKFILMPLGIAALIAMLLQPISEWLEKLKMGRILSIILSILLVVIVAAGIFFTSIYRTGSFYG